MALRTRREMLRSTGAVAGAVTTVGLAGCVGGFVGSSQVRVSSKRFTEQNILGYMAIEALKANTELSTVDETGLGGTTQNFQALKSGDIDMYWEYTGTAWNTLPPQHNKIINDPKKLYQEVKKDFNQEHSLSYLDRAPLDNTFVLMANPDWVEKTGIKSLSDFAKYVNNGNTDFKLALTAEFLGRADGWEGVAKAYEFTDALDKLKSNINQVGIGLTYQIVGKGEAQIGLGFNTNPNIPRYNLTVLEDPQEFFVAYNPAPLVDGKLVENNSSIQDALNPISPKLTTDQIRKLNKRVSIDNQGPQKVAREFLSSEGLL